MVTYSRKVLWLPICVRVDAALPFQVLRLQSDAGEGENFVLVAQRGMAVNNNVRMEAATVAQSDIFANDAITAQ